MTPEIQKCIKDIQTQYAKMPKIEFLAQKFGITEQQAEQEIKEFKSPVNLIKNKDYHLLANNIVKGALIIITILAGVRSGYALYSYFASFDALAIVSAIIIAGLSALLPQSAIKLWQNRKKLLSVIVIAIYVPVAIVSILATNANLFDSKSQVLAVSNNNEKNIALINSQISEIDKSLELDRLEKKDLLDKQNKIDVSDKNYNRTRNNLATLENRISSKEQTKIKLLESLGTIEVKRSEGIGQFEQLMNWSFAIVLEISGALSLVLSIFI